MTVLIGWIGVDSRSPCSAYLMSDSLFSWNATKKEYSFGQKLFAFENSPDIFGYCGDVVFPSQLLCQLAVCNKRGLLFPQEANSDEHSEIIERQLNIQVKEYPKEHLLGSKIYHICKDNKTGCFSAYRYAYKSLIQRWETTTIPINLEKSDLIIYDGSGASKFYDNYLKYQSGDLCYTSRNIYQCFCESLKSDLLPACGGPPQLVGLYRGEKFNGMEFGTIHENKRFLSGGPAPIMKDYNVIRWYNDNFEICDGNTLEIFSDAMRQPNPNH